LLGELLGLSLKVARLTKGAFDPTVKPILDELGFYREIGSKPDSAGLEGALARVGWKRVAYRESGKTVRFARQGMALDFGGIGKGYALDRAGAYLAANGILRARLELGRSYLLMGGDPNETAGRFRLGVAVPDEEGTETLQAVIFVPDGAVATSSPMSQTRHSSGRLAGHIVDPRRGILATDVLSATVWAPTGAMADALATALVVTGPSGMRRLARKTRFEALLILQADPNELPHESVDPEGLAAARGTDRRRIVATRGLVFSLLNE